MKAAEKIRLIRTIAECLSRYEYSDIDLILGQFNQSTTSQWSGEKRDYVISMISSSDDLNLKELHDFVLDENNEKALVPNTITKSVEQCWSEGDVHLFISHSSLDKSDVAKLKKILSSYRVSCFVAHEDINTSEDWEKEIICGLDSCHALIAWVTDDFNASSYAQQEIGVALSKGKCVIPIRNGANPKGFLSRIQGAREFKLPSEIAKHVIETLLSKSKTHELTKEAILRSFEEASSFTDATSKIELIEKIDTWSQSDLKRLKESPTKNRQISGAFHVEEKINSILKKLKFIDIQPEIRPEDLPF